MGEIKAFTREKLLEMFYAVYEKDAQKIIQALIELGALVPTGDMGSVSFPSVFSFRNFIMTMEKNLLVLIVLLLFSSEHRGTGFQEDAFSLQIMDYEND